MSILKNSFPYISILFIAALVGCNKNEPLPPEVNQLLRTTVEVKVLPASLKDQKELQKAWTEMASFYGKHGYQPAWFTPKGLRPQAAELLQAIPALGIEGLDVRRYQPARLQAKIDEMKDVKDFSDPLNQRRLVDLDVELTYTYLSLASHLATGRLQPEKLRVEWYTQPRNVDLDAHLDKALAADDAMEMVAIFRGLTPPNPDYKRLTQALVQYKTIAAKGGWNTVPEGKTLKTGDNDPRVAALRQRLSVPGPAIYDDALASAVSRFQQSHGLEITGKVGEETLAELNVPVADRIKQIQVNMERWRWLPASFGDRYILVNVPEFKLDLVEEGKPVYTMRVVVGKEQSRTPAFSDKMTYLELNPYWNIPSTIVNAEILPKLAADPNYLASHNMERTPGSENRFRQLPGPDNALGRIKFMFPNEFDIYLHDTPADHLFSRTERDFSHGCIRLEKPVELANLLLKGDPKWTPEALQAALNSGEQKTITLKHPLPVHILYWTTWVEPDGTVQFRKDLYGHDARLEEALAKEPPVWIDLPSLRGEVKAGL